MAWFKPAVRTLRHAVLSACHDAVGALRLEGSAELPRVAGFALREGQPLSDDLLGRLAREAGIDGLPLITLLDQERYQTVMVEAPSVPEEEIRGAIRWKVKDLINFHVDDAVLDHLPIPGGGGRGQALYVVAAQSQAVRDLAKTFQEADLHLDVIDIRESAQHNVALRLAPADYAVAVLHGDGENGLLTFSFGTDLVMSRRIEGRGASGDAFHDRLALETQRSVDYFERQFSWLPLAKLYLAPAPDNAILARKFQEYLSLGVEPIDLARLFDLSGTVGLLDARIQNQAFHLLGAALREPAP